jgi:hypothetical protein
VLGNGSRHRSDLCCSAEFVSANCPQQEIADPEWASRIKVPHPLNLAMNYGRIF